MCYSDPFPPRYNATILAYGQTGSGKTHTVLGGEKSLDGIIPRALAEIFDEAERVKASGRSMRQKGSKRAVGPMIFISVRIFPQVFLCASAPVFLRSVMPRAVSMNRLRIFWIPRASRI